MSELGTFISPGDLRKILSPSPRTKTLNPKHYFVTDTNSNQLKEIRERLTAIYALITQLDFYNYEILKKTYDSLINNIKVVVAKYHYCTSKRLALLFLAQLDDLLKNNNTCVTSRQFNEIRRELNFNNCGPETFTFMAMKRLQNDSSKTLIQSNTKKRITVYDYLSLYETKLLQNTKIIRQTDEVLKYVKLKRHFQGHPPSKFVIVCLYLVYSKQKITWKKIGEIFSINTNNGNIGRLAKKIRLLMERPSSKAQGKANIDFLISILLIVKPEAPLGLAETMRARMRDFVEAGLCEPVKLSSGVRRERIKRFVEEYS